MLSRRSLLLIGLTLFIPWLLVTLLFWNTGPVRKTRATASPSIPQNADVTEGKPGLWGQLNYIRIATEMPNEFAFVISSEIAPQRWFFKGQTREQAMAVLQAAGMSMDELASLSGTNRWEITPAGCWVHPDVNLVLGMNSEVRGKIYLQLTRHTENRAQRAAFPFRPERLKERLETSGLSNESIALFRKLLYKQGPFLLFADLEHVLPKLSNDEERRRFIKMVSRKSTLLVKLKIDMNTDIELLTAYWGAAGRAKDLRPLLESLAGIKGGTFLDIVHLLPPFARERLYTYPVISANTPTSVQDCNWTTMNFFSTVPDDRYANMEYLAKKLQEDYYQIGTAERLGDLVFLILPSGESVHSAIFVADNILFTKNGVSVSQPWILMTLEDLLELYSAPYPPDEALKPLFYRRKTM